MCANGEKEALARSLAQKQAALRARGVCSKAQNAFVIRTSSYIAGGATVHCAN